MKVALCFSGHIRDVQINADYWKNLLKDHEVSVFGSFWDDYQNEENGDTFLNFESLYSPVKLEIESYSAFKESTLSVASKRVSVPVNSFHQYFVDMAHNFIQLSMFYKIWRSNMLSKTGEVYDVVIRARTDSYLDENFSIEKSNYIKVPIGFYLMNSDAAPNYPEHSQGIDDCFGYGPPDMMDYYAFTHLNVMNYFEQGYSLLTSEHFLKLHLSKARVPMHMIPHHLTITRRWRNENDILRNGFVKEPYSHHYWSDEVDMPLDPEITSFRNPNKISFEV
jgi:hypothetical protein